MKPHFRLFSAQQQPADGNLNQMTHPTRFFFKGYLILPNHLHPYLARNRFVRFS